MREREGGRESVVCKVIFDVCHFQVCLLLHSNAYDHNDIMARYNKIQDYERYVTLLLVSFPLTHEKRSPWVCLSHAIKCTAVRRGDHVVGHGWHPSKQTFNVAKVKEPI